MPDITGRTNLIKFGAVSGSVSSSGAFTWDTGDESSVSVNSEINKGRAFVFYANNCSSIYGSSNTVQPVSIRVFPCIKI